MFPKINLIPAKDLPKVDLLVKQYNDLPLAAERYNRDNHGKFTTQEMEYFSQAAKACEQILNLVPSEEAIYHKWQHRQKNCLRIVDEIHNMLFPPHTPDSPPSEEPDTPAVETKTASVFVTKNACKEVPAEEIEKWYQKKCSVTHDALTGMALLKDSVKTLKLWREGQTSMDYSPIPLPALVLLRPARYRHDPVYSRYRRRADGSRILSYRTYRVRHLELFCGGSRKEGANRFLGSYGPCPLHSLLR